MKPRVVLSCCVKMFPTFFVILCGCASQAAPRGSVTSSGSPPSVSYGLAGGYAVNDDTVAWTVNVIDLNNPSVTDISSSLVTSGIIHSTAISADGTKGLLGGEDDSSSPTGLPIAYVVNVPTGSVTSISSFGTVTGQVTNVSMDPTGQSGVLGGGDTNSGSAFAFSVDIASATATPIALSQSGAVSAVALAAPFSGSGNVGLLAGDDTTNFFAYFLKGDKTAVLAATGTGIIAASSSSSDASGSYGIFGGDDGAANPSPIAYFMNFSSSTVTSISMPSGAGGEIFSVAVSQNGNAILGGWDGTLSGDVLLAFTSTVSNPVATPIGGLFSTGRITGVAIDSQGVNGLLGGGDLTSGTPYAYTVNFSAGTATAITLPSSGTAVMNDVLAVAISNNGQVGLLGGTDTSSRDLFLYLVTGISGASGSNPAIATNISISPAIQGGGINSVSLDFLLSLLSSIPTIGLKGNNWTLADYINANAPDTASYFLPSQANGTLNEALESAAPTRNAFSIFAMDNAVFYARSALTVRSQDSRLLNRSLRMQPTASKGELGYLAARDDQLLSCSKKGRPNQIWGEIIGADAYQKSQQQTPKFQPLSFGFVLGYDYEKEDKGRIGGGLAYMYTHLIEKENAGHSNLNQELIFAYGLWNQHQFYINASIWFGIFQNKNVRNIHMTGFQFESKSHPRGLQFDPHLEIGYSGDFCDDQCIIEPFYMIDWVHNWQPRYEETSKGPFKFGQNQLHSSMLRNELGLRFYEIFSYEVWKLTLQEAASYVNKKPYSVGSVNAYLVGAPGNFAVETLSWTQNLGSAALQFLFEPMDSRYPSGMIAYRGEFGSRYQSHQVGMNVDWGF